MRKKRKWHRELMIVLAAIIIGAGCFFAGVAASSSRYQAEREMRNMKAAEQSIPLAISTHMMKRV